MTHFFLNVFFNLALLVVVLSASYLFNRLMPGVKLNGAHVFFALMLLAMVLDATLTFLVFADARSRYGQFSSTAAFLERAGAYVAAAGIALISRRVAQRRSVAQAAKRDAVVIRTSPYSESHLPM
ncbi:hypothetical protein AAGS40_02455 [Paraburkholderia sp. PREW-6R]|uniref:hypothetical protein n=1 Tax=Paraburkholderia sp. PREW-6R TaxID=3141544 RepID=UPI0031F5ADA3